MGGVVDICHFEEYINVHIGKAIKGIQRTSWCGSKEGFLTVIRKEDNSW